MYLTRLITFVSEICTSQASDDGEREIMGEESQSTVGVHSEREGKSVQGVRMAGLGPQSESQNGAQRMAMLESVIFALVIGRAIDFVDRLQPLEGSIRPEITEEGSASKAQIDDPGSGSSRDTSTTEPEPLSKSIELSQIVPRRKLPTIHETGESSRGKTLSRESVRLVTCWNSPFAHRVAISLREKGVRYGVIEESTLNKNVRTLNANPLSKRIPILMHGGRVISESRIIMEYIDEAWPDSSTALLPIDPFERSAARYWSDYIDQKVRISSLVSVSAQFSHQVLDDIYAVPFALGSIHLLGPRLLMRPSSCSPSFFAKCLRSEPITSVMCTSNHGSISFSTCRGGNT